VTRLLNNYFLTIQIAVLTELFFDLKGLTLSDSEKFKTSWLLLKNQHEGWTSQWTVLCTAVVILVYLMNLLFWASECTKRTSKRLALENSDCLRFI